MSQIGLLFGIYIVGLLFGMLFVQRIAAAYLVSAAFLFGAVFFTLYSLLLLAFRLPYTMTALILFVAAGILILGLLNLIRGTFREITRENNIYPWLLGLAACAAVLIFARDNNLSIATSDSFAYILNGRTLAINGLNPQSAGWLSSFGVMLPVLQASSIALDESYLYALSPLLGITLLATSGVLIYQGAQQYTAQRYLARLIAVVSVLVLGSSNFVIFHTFYVHTNILEAAFLVNAVGNAWLGLAQKKRSWLALSLVAWLGFSLGRPEAPLVALLFLTLMISCNVFPWRISLALYLPYLIVVSLWLVLLGYLIGSGSTFLTPMRIALFLLAYLGAAVMVLLGEVRWGQRLLSWYPWLLVGGLAFSLVLMFVTRPAHMLESSVSLFTNLFTLSGRWGAIWYGIAILSLLALRQRKLPNERIFAAGIPAFILLVLGLSYLRIPYHANWWDSANRMMLHVLPVWLVYLAVKFYPRWVERVQAAIRRVDRFNSKAGPGPDQVPD